MHFLLAACLALAVVGCGSTAASSSAATPAFSETADSQTQPTPTADPEATPEATPEAEASSRILVAYFSCTGHTQAVAEQIAQQTGADLYEITPADPYTVEDLNYNDNNCRANQEMNDLAARCHGWAQFQAMENHYNLLYREDEQELIPICRQMGVSLMPYSPLAAGHLTRPEWTTDTLRSRTDRVAMGKYDRTKEQDLEIVHRVHTLAERCGVKMQQIALAWHWAKGVASPIIGATKAAHFDDASAALNVRRRMWPIWSSRICPTRLWAPSTRTRRRALCCWTKRNKPFCNAKQKHRGTSAG